MTVWVTVHIMREDMDLIVDALYDYAAAQRRLKPARGKRINEVRRRLIAITEAPDDNTADEMRSLYLKGDPT